MVYRRACLSDAGAADSVNRVRHVRLGVGSAVRAPNGAESRILIRDTWNTDILSELTPEPGETVLYKNRFSIVVGAGHLNEIKLRCDKRYVFFKYDPQMTYDISDKYGRCEIELVGETGTKFALTQS